MIKPILLLTLCFFLVGCSTCYTDVDQEKRNKIFMECLDKLKEIKGPTETVYNDWDEVVDACEDAAFYQSQKKVCN